MCFDSKYAARMRSGGEPCSPDGTVAGCGLRFSGSGLAKVMPAGQSAPWSIQARSNPTCSADHFLPFLGIVLSGSVPATSATMWLWSLLPSTATGPVSPPFRNDSRGLEAESPLVLPLGVALDAARLEQRLEVFHEIDVPRSGRGQRSRGAAGAGAPDGASAAASTHATPPHASISTTSGKTRFIPKPGKTGTFFGKARQARPTRRAAKPSEITTYCYTTTRPARPLLAVS